MAKMFIGICKYCGNSYKGYSEQFCSLQCRNDSMAIFLPCKVCHKIFRIKLSQYRKGIRCCSLACKHKGKVTHRLISYQGRDYFECDQGYFRTRDPDIYLHQQVWLDNFGDIPNGYVVHHKDENKSNNAIENLELLTISEHTKHHNQYKRRNNYGQFLRPE